VFKRYGKAYEFESGTIELSDCKLYHSPTGRWWAWVGMKDESGAYKVRLMELTSFALSSGPMRSRMAALVKKGKKPDDFLIKG
jgi:hypothetical protein